MGLRRETIGLGVGLGLVVLVLGACSYGLDAWGYKAALEEAQRDYTQALRWGEPYRASEFVDPEHMDEFLASAKELGAFRLTDYEIHRFDVDDARDAATVTVVYRGYSPRSLTEVEITENQQWARESVKREWHVRPTIEGRPTATTPY